MAFLIGPRCKLRARFCDGTKCEWSRAACMEVKEDWGKQECMNVWWDHICLFLLIYIYIYNLQQPEKVASKIRPGRMAEAMVREQRRIKVSGVGNNRVCLTEGIQIGKGESRSISAHPHLALSQVSSVSAYAHDSCDVTPLSAHLARACVSCDGFVLLSLFSHSALFLLSLAYKLI